MARVIANQTNVWGRSGGVDIQRSDLWVVDFSAAVAGLKNNQDLDPTSAAAAAFRLPPPSWSTYYAQSVVLPELKVRPEAVRRDSRPYQMPSWDDPLEAITMTFLLDSSTVSPYNSPIYEMLDFWRASVRAGRGGFSSEYAMFLDANYGYAVGWRFDVLLNLMTGTSPVVTTGNGPDDVTNDLAFSTKLTLKNCWLGSFRLSELNYEGARPVILTAIFYADDILRTPAPATGNPTVFGPNPSAAPNTALA